jgi:hypothetical protein
MCWVAAISTIWRIREAGRTLRFAGKAAALTCEEHETARSMITFDASDSRVLRFSGRTLALWRFGWYRPRIRVMVGADDALVCCPIQFWLHEILAWKKRKWPQKC